MIDWLRRDPAGETMMLAGRELPVQVVRHATAKRMVLRLSPDGETVKVTIPRWGRTAEALEFARSRHDWLAAQVAKRPTRQAPVAGGRVMYRGEAVRIDWHPSHPRKVALAEAVVRLGGPEERIEARLKAWLRAEALHLFEQDAARYSCPLSLPPPVLLLSNARRRWGSCSSDGTMRLNWRLVQAPDHVRRSVVAHETAHRVHFDHSPAFHAQLAALFGPGLGEAENWLRRNGPTLFASFG